MQLRRRFAALLALVPTVALLLAVNPLAPAASAAPKHGAPKWALLVGINNYRGAVAKTAGSVGDVEDLKQVLINSGWPADHVRTLTDDQATGEAIRAGWRWLASVSTDASFSVFHYSGHTKQMSGDKDRDGEALDEYLWPVDNNFLSDAELGAAMRRVKGHSWTDMSGCEAAGYDDGISAPTRLFTGASRENEKGYDSADWKNSIFTGLLADRGITQGRADANTDGIVTIHEAFKYAEVNAPELTKRQAKGPQHPYLAGGDGTEWYLNPPAPAPKTEEPPERSPFWPWPLP